ncbi:MAG: GNAT family N-acetyltransferase [Anaerolineales bacterium]|nr:GNAT family N-acetyltransferase [Anaerolineales bacterium]
MGRGGVWYGRCATTPCPLVCMMSNAEPAGPELQFSIESAGLRDLGALRQLEKACFPLDAWPMLDLIGVLTFPGVVRLKAVVDGRLVGFIAGDIRGQDGLAWVATVGVLPEFRGRGIGSALMRACEGRIGQDAIRLCVRMENEGAIRLYERFGYVKVGEWTRYYQDGGTAMVMEKVRRE